MEDAIREQYAPDESSSYADEGSAAHALAEHCLQEDSNAEQHIGLTFSDYPDYPVDQAMADGVQIYLDYVRSQEGELLIEQRVDFSQWVPDGFGTSDAIVIGHGEDEGIVTVIDLKYGKGHRVDAEDNSQAMLYALGVLNQYGFIYDCPINSDLFKLSIAFNVVIRILFIPRDSKAFYDWCCSIFYTRKNGNRLCCFCFYKSRERLKICVGEISIATECGFAEMSIATECGFDEISIAIECRFAEMSISTECCFVEISIATKCRFVEISIATECRFAEISTATECRFFEISVVTECCFAEISIATECRFAEISISTECRSLKII